MSDETKPNTEPQQDEPLMNEEELDSVAGGCQWTDSGLTGEFTRPMTIPTWPTTDGCFPTDSIKPII